MFQVFKAPMAKSVANKDQQWTHTCNCKKKEENSIKVCKPTAVKDSLN